MAHLYQARVRWQRQGAVFTDRRYSRAHEWLFDEGLVVPASASPLVVPPPRSRPDAVDPEEAVVAAASACHMLFALDFLARAGFRVDSYDDEASGEMGPNARGKLHLARIVLRPRLTLSGDTLPDEAALAAIHHEAHDACYIAHSLSGEVVVEPRPTVIA